MPDTSDEGKALGLRIRRYRIDKGLNQTELATAAGLSKTYISELESGAGRRPSADVLLRISDALGVTIADLLGRSVRPKASSDIPSGLAEFAEREGLNQADVMMLASIRFRGDAPQTAQRWRLIYDAIRTSKVLDDE